jgi:hypothetical protein
MDRLGQGTTTLLGENVGRDYAEHVERHGKVRFWRLGKHIAVFESSGNLNVEHAKFIIEQHKKHIESGPRPYYTFGNWSNLKGYSPEVRHLLTQWQVDVPYDEVHVAHNSQMLAMSISLANAVMSNTIKVHATEELLDDALLTIRKRHGA